MTLPQLITRLRQRLAELGDDAQATPAELRALVAVAEECEMWRQVDGESRDQTPVPDLALRAHCRNKARMKEAEANAALEAIP